MKPSHEASSESSSSESGESSESGSDTDSDNEKDAPQKPEGTWNGGSENLATPVRMV